MTDNELRDALARHGYVARNVSPGLWMVHVEQTPEFWAVIHHKEGDKMPTKHLLTREQVERYLTALNAARKPK
jgi:hypothetical protein